MADPRPIAGPRRLLAVALATACGLVGSAVKAEEPDRGGAERPFVERIAVDLVEVEVQATDSAGDPVLDLAAEDLVVLDDGQPVRIEHFSGPARGSTGRVWTSPGSERAAGGERPLAAAPGTRLVLFLDDLATSPVSRQRLVAAVGQALDGRLGPSDQVLVARYSGGVEVIQPFTHDRGQIDRALASLRELRAYHLMMGLESERTLDTLRLSLQNDNTAGAATSHPNRDICVGVGEVVQSYADQARSRVIGAIGALKRFVRSLAGVPGRKVLLYVSDGIPLVAGGEAWRYAIEMCDGTAMRAGVSGAADVTSMGGVGQARRFDPIAARVDMEKYDTTNEWLSLTAQANAQGVTLYTIQAAGLVGARSAQANLDVRMTVGAEQFARRNLQDPLEIIARETGGRAIFNTNDATAALEEILDEAETRYVLAYTPPRPADGREHSIEVESRRPGIRLRYRERYRAKTFEDRVVDGVLASLYHGEEDNRLGVKVEIAGRTAIDDHLTRLKVRVRVPLSELTLLPDARGRQGLFTVYLAARDDDGGTTPIRSRSIPVRLPAADAAAAAGPGVAEGADFVYEVEIDLRNRPHDLALGVRDDFGGTTAFVRKRIEPRSLPGPAPAAGAANG